MKSDYVLIGSVLFLAIGLGLICGYTQGTGGFTAAYPASGASLQISINTRGWPAMAGLVLTLLGAVLLIAAFVSAIVRQYRRNMHGPRLAL